MPDKMFWQHKKDKKIKIKIWIWIVVSQVQKINNPALLDILTETKLDWTHEALS